MPIHLAIKADWKTPELLIQGSLGCAKTTVGLDKEIDALLKYPGIQSLLFRWTQDAVDTKLKTAFEELLNIRGLKATWDAKQKRYEFENGSAAFMFGLKAVSAIEQYNKIRGLGVSRIFGDQVEEMAQEVAGELRGRLRPDLTATMNNRRFPFQLTFVSNPEDTDFWLSKEFPEDNHVKGRKLFQLSVFDNKHLPQESIDSLLRQYPPEHPKNLTMVMGRRGPNITGVPVYDGLYEKELHHRRMIANRALPFLESFEFGKHNPVYVLGQQMYTGGVSLLGGMRGQEMSLSDFLPIVKHYRQTWIPAGAKILTCTSPMGEKATAAKYRYTPMEILRASGFRPTYADNGNAHDVRLGAIENVASLLRWRTVTGEQSLGINDDPSAWLVASNEGIKESAFMHIAFEAGYTWHKNNVSVSSKEILRPVEDDKFANAMHCVENIILNFCAGMTSPQERDRRARQGREQTQGTPQQQSSGKARWMV